MRFASPMIVVAFAGLAGVAAGKASSPRPPTVPCSDIIGGVKSGHENGYRLALGVVSVPPAQLAQIVPMHSRPWAYWRKAGLNVHAGSGPISVIVPRSWRKRVAITWGSTPVVSSLRIAACSPAVPGYVWNSYAGGFYLRSRSACAPLIFRVGKRSTTVRFGLGRTCGPK